jgi:hypothetical protein
MDRRETNLDRKYSIASCSDLRPNVFTKKSVQFLRFAIPGVHAGLL